MEKSKQLQLQQECLSLSPNKTGQGATYVAPCQKGIVKMLSNIFTPQFTVSMVSLSLMLTMAICLVQFLYTPPLLRWLFNRAVRRCGLHNAQGEYPLLVSVKRDKEKAHGLILKVRNKGVSVPDFDRNIERLKASLNGSIYRIEYARNVSYILLWFLPQKYVRPALLTPDDSAVGKMGIRHLINLLVVGATGTGKTIVMKIILVKIIKFCNNAKLYILDFKQQDFRFLAGLPGYFGFDACIDGLLAVYAIFKDRQSHGITAKDPTIYLVIDEWASFILWLQSVDKKLAEQMLKILAELMMLGRGFYIIPIVGAQRPDATFFASSRDNFQACLALGNLSREGRKMVFPDEVVGTVTQCGKREGHLYIDGVGLEKICVANITDIGVLDTIIREAMSR